MPNQDLGRSTIDPDTERNLHTEIPVMRHDRSQAPSDELRLSRPLAKAESHQDDADRPQII